MFLGRLCALLSLAAVASSKVYTRIVGTHATSAMLETPLPSAILCASLCLRHPNCTHWMHDTDSSLCSLYPAISLSAAVAAATVLYASSLPVEYTIVPDLTYKAFRIHVDENIPIATDIMQACARDGDGALAAFPNDDVQISFLRNEIAKTTADFFWVGIFETNVDGVYRDPRDTRRLAMKPEWLTPKAAQNLWNFFCVWMGKAGIESTECKAVRGYICEFERY